MRAADDDDHNKTARREVARMWTWRRIRAESVVNEPGVDPVPRQLRDQAGSEVSTVVGCDDEKPSGRSNQESRRGAGQRNTRGGWQDRVTEGRGGADGFDGFIGVAIRGVCVRAQALRLYVYTTTTVERRL